MDALVATRDKLQQQKTKVDNMYELLFESGEGDPEGDVAALDELSARVDDVMATVAKALGRTSMTTGATAATAPESNTRQGARAKPNEALKPFKLSKDHTRSS